MTCATPLSRLFIASAIFLAVLTPAFAENWPQWRGANNDAISKETGLPISWSATKNVAWKLTLPGKGSSTPIVWGNRIFLTAADGADLVLLCVSTDGKQLWKSKIGPASKSAYRMDEGNDASACPSTDGKHVFTFVGSGDMACFDFDGKEIWKFNAQKRYGTFSIYHGIHVTPLLHEDRLYLALLHSNGPGGRAVIALDKATGKEIWKVERATDAKGESPQAYTSPCLWQNGKELNLVVVGADYATGHRLSDGAEVWRLGELNPQGAKYSTAYRIITSPIATADMLFVPTCRGGIVVALKPGASGFIKAGSPSEQWRIAKGAPDVPSPVVHDGLLYLQRENGVLNCLDAKTGTQLSELNLHRDRYRASPIYADGKIYTVSRDGNFSVIKAGPKAELLATNVLPDVFTASPAVSQGRLYLRGFETLYAISEGGK